MDRAARQQRVDIEWGVGETGVDVVARHGKETLVEMELSKLGQEEKVTQWTVVRKTGFTRTLGKSSTTGRNAFSRRMRRSR